MVILMLSPCSVKRRRLNFEARAAWGREIPIIPGCFFLSLTTSAGLRKETLRGSLPEACVASFSSSPPVVSDSRFSYHLVHR